MGAARYWDGRGWTHDVAWGGRTYTDSTPLEDVRRRAELHDHAIVLDYLEDAQERSIVTEEVIAALRNDVQRSTRTAPVATLTAPAPRPSPVTPRPSTAAPRTAGPAPAPVPAPARVAPGQVSLWWDEARRTVRSDLALHGLAYLGVLLLFAGVTGLIVFSFGDVSPWIRSLTELMIPTALFTSAWYLSSRGARVVGDALALLGGAVTPIVVAAAFTDGAPIPPDIDGSLLPVVQGLSVALVAVVMAVVVRRHPTSPLRFLVGPISWLAAGLAAGALRDPVPSGDEVARPEALQLGAILAALALTLLVCWIRDAAGPLSSAMRAVALPVAAVVFALELILAGDEGWPLPSTIVTAVAALVLLETSTARLSNALLSSLQFAVIGITALRVASIGEPQWVAVGTLPIVLALLEYVGHRRRDQVASWVGSAVAVMLLFATLSEPTTAALGFGMLTAWGLWRYLAPPEWLPVPDTYGILPAIGAAVTTGALWQLADPGAGVVAAAVAVLLLAGTGRIWPRMSADVLWTWFVPASACAVWLAALNYRWGTFPEALAAAGMMISAALALSALPLAVRVWASSAALVWALANAAEALGIGRNPQAVTVATAGLALVVARPVCVHLAAMGHLAGLLALAIPAWPGWAPTVVATLAAIGWWTTTLVDDRGEAIPLGAVRRVLSIGDAAADAPGDIATELSGLIALGLTVVVSVAAFLAVEADLEVSWIEFAGALGLLVVAGAVRAVHWRRARRRVFEWATFVGVTVAAFTAIMTAGHVDDDWSAVATTALGLAVIALATPRRPILFIWTAWIGAAALTILMGNRVGVESEALDTLLTGWGAVALVGGVAIQRHRRGPVTQSRLGDDPLLVPPMVLGACAFAFGGASALSAGSETAIGWTAAAMAMVVLVVALLLPLGALTAIAELLATAAYAVLAPWDPNERPATFVPWVVLLLVAALLTRTDGRPWPKRWDLPSFWVAHAVGGAVLIRAATTDTAAITFALFAAVALAIAVLLSRFEWAAGAAILLLIAGVDAGRGWLALVLATEGLALTVVGLRRAGVARWVLVSTGAVAFVGSWFDFTVWLDWSNDTIVRVTVAAAAAMAFAAAVLRRLHVVPTEAAIVWSATGTLVSVGSMIGGVDVVPRLTGGLIFAVATLVLAATAGAIAPVTGPVMRWVAAGAAAAAWVPAWWALQPSATAATLAGTSVALGTFVAALIFHGLRPSWTWITPMTMYAVATQALATLTATSALPEQTLTIVVLLAVAAELIALGVIQGRPELFVLAPAAACGAWVLAIRDTMAGQPNWFTIPIGTTLLVMVGLVRWIRRGRGAPVTGYDVIALEIVGMTVVVASPLAGILAGDLWNAIPAITVGVILGLWGAVTRVRRRTVFGALTVVVATVMVIGLPLSEMVTWRGPALWLALSLLGIAAILVASGLERGRDAVRQAGRRFDEMTQGWERIPHRDRGGHTDPFDHPPSGPTGDEVMDRDPQLSP